MAEVYDHNEIMRAIGRLEGKVDGINDTLTRYSNDAKETRSLVDSHQSFIDNWKGRIVTVSIFAGFGSAFLAEWIRSKIGSK